MTNYRPHEYVPALKYDVLTPFYDRIAASLLRERSLKQHLLAQTAGTPHMHALDVGCGTGTLALLAKGANPSATLVGFDGDWSILQHARAKPENRDAPVAWHCGTAGALPYADSTFDVVYSSLLFHHLTYSMKRLAFSEILRVLRPRGQLVIGDWGPPTNHMMRLLFVPVQLLDGFLTTDDNVRGVLPLLMEEVGFTGVRKTATFETLLGTLSCYTGYKRE